MAQPRHHVGTDLGEIGQIRERLSYTCSVIISCYNLMFGSVQKHTQNPRRRFALSAWGSLG